MGHCLLFAIFATFTLTALGQSAILSSSSNHALRDWKNPWKMELEKRGLADYSLPRPFRYAIPLTKLGSEDSKLMFTYATRMPGDTGSKGFLLFAKIRFD